MSTKTIRVLPNDAKEPVEIAYDTVAMKCLTLKNILEDLGSGATQHTLPLPNVTAETLHIVCSYLTKHAEEVRVEQTVNFQNLNDWEVAFFSLLEPLQLLELLVAQEYLGCTLLETGAGKYCASVLEGKSPQEVRDYFGIANDYTAEELAKVARNADPILQGERVGSATSV